MALPQSETTEPAERRGQKRVLEVPVERSKKKRKEEKENRRSNSSTSSTESENMKRRPRKAVPKKWENKEMPMCSAKELQELFKSSSCMQGMFLTRNVVQRRALEAGQKKKFRIRRRVKLRHVMKKIRENASEDELFSVAYAKIQSWAALHETKNENCSTALLESFVIFVDKKGVVEAVSLGTSVLPLGSEKVTYAGNVMFTHKTVSCPPEKRKELRCVYLAVVATRMIPKVGKRNTRGATAISTELVPEVKIGCRLMLDMHRDIGCMSWGLQHIILGGGEDFGGDQLFSDDTSWMSSWQKLRLIDQRNKLNDDSHRPRVILSAHPEEPSDEEHPQVTGDDMPSSSGFDCPIRKIPFKSIKELELNFISRYPCFSLNTKKRNQPEVVINKEFFESKDDSKNAFFYRNNADRTVPFKSDLYKRNAIKKSLEDGACNWPARNSGPGFSEPKYGLDFVRSNGQTRILDTLFKDRTAPVSATYPNPEPEPVELTEEEIKKRKINRRRYHDGDNFPVNNAKMFCDVAIFHKDYPVLHEIPEPESDETETEMKVAKLPVTREETIAFNEKLLDLYKTRNKRGKVIHTNDVPNIDPTVVEKDGFDFNGHPINTYVELYFPPLKSELYNVYLRFFLAENGLRPGHWDSAHKSRVLTGFIERFWKEIFENKLENIFLKHIQLTASASTRWTSEDTERPAGVFSKLRNQWLAEQKKE